MDPLIQELTKEQIRDDIPAFRAGDTVTVHVRVVEGTHERIQLFEGVVIKKKGTGIGATYTVRKIASGVGVERTFPVNDVLQQFLLTCRDVHVSSKAQRDVHDHDA